MVNPRMATARSCFNEAPARMRGKTRPPRAAPQKDLRFNEAPARMRGKTCSDHATATRARLASMRPPHECGGKPLRDAAGNTLWLKLQ